MKRSSFWILPKKIQRLDVKNLQKYSRFEKLPQQILLKKRKAYTVMSGSQKCSASNIYPNNPMLKEEADDQAKI